MNEEGQPEVVEKAKTKLSPKAKLCVCFAVVVMALLLLIFVVWSGQNINRLSADYGAPSSRVVTTSASISGLAGYTKVYEDADNDYAIFYKDQYSANQLDTGTRVFIGSSAATVTESHDTYVYCKLEKKVTTILPGTSAEYDGVPFGFVSSVDGDLVTVHYY